MHAMVKIVLFTFYRWKMAIDPKEVFDTFNPELVQLLPLKDAHFMANLTKQHLFSGTLKEEVLAASTQADATTRFLYRAIERPLDVGKREPFDRLLLVMEKCNDPIIKELAREIKQNFCDTTSSVS